MFLLRSEVKVDPSLVLVSWLRAKNQKGVTVKHSLQFGI